MKPNWAEGYVSEIGYTYGFYRELTPGLIQFYLLLNGVMPPALDGTYTYCELGFGQGLSTNLLAASNPRGQFWGTDFNPEQAAFAREIASLSQNNAILLDDSFSEFLERETPKFDFIVLHGTWSWVNLDAQQAILEILRQKLKIGGAVYISYNVLPGWAQELPLRDLMMLHTELGSSVGNGITRRIEDAIHFADQLQASGARYFSANPKVEDFLGDLKADDRQYLAHEYFNQCWDLMYFSDLARRLESAKLEFACSAHQLDLLEVLNFRGSLSRTLSKIENPLLREVARDFALNRRFRRDIFTRGARRLSTSEKRALLLDVKFMLQTPIDEIPNECCGPENEIPLDQALYVPLIEFLASTIESKSLREILAARGLGDFPMDKIIQALKILVALRHIHPIFSVDEASCKVAHTARFNQVIMDRARHDNNMKYLASPLLAGGIAVNRFHLLFLLAKHHGMQAPEQWAQFAWESISAIEPRIRIQGRVLEDPKECKAEFERRALQFSRRELPLFEKLGIA